VNDIQAIRSTGVGAVTTARTRITGLSVLHNASGAGRLTFTDGNGGPVRLDLDFEATADSAQINFCENGILFTSGVYLSTATNITAATIFYVG